MEVRISDEGTIRWEYPFAAALRRARALAAEMGHRPLLPRLNESCRAWSPNGPATC